MNTLNIIQILAKLGKIFSKIVFVCCIVAFCLCFAGIVSLVLGVEALHFGNITLERLIEENSGYGVGTLYAVMVVGMIITAGEAVVAKFAEHYFTRELEDGTPFCMDGAKELMCLGVLTVCIPLIARLIASIARNVLAVILSDVAPLKLNFAGSLVMGMMFVVLSLVCRYGAEQAESKEHGGL